MDINSFVIGYKKGKASVPTGGGSVELNIAYGDTAPEDTSKLWVKTTQPSGVVVSPNVEYEVLEGDSITTLTETLPNINGRMGCAAVGSNIYMLGGSGGSAWYSIVCFDPETKINTTLATVLPIALTQSVCASAGTKIYLLGGSQANTSSSSIVATYRFDTETEEVTKLSASINKATNHAGAKYGSDIYLFGGQYHQSSKTYYRNSIQCFNTETETVTTLSATLPAARAGMGCACVGAKIYLFGGFDSAGSYAEIICFDVETQKVSVIESTLPSALRYLSAASLGDKIYLFGGYTGASYVNTIICFDTKTETCEVLPIDIGEARYGIGTGVIGETAYLFGGTLTSSSGGLTQIDQIQEFAGGTKVPKIASGGLQIDPQSQNNFFRFINTDTVKADIGVKNVYKGNADGHGELVEAALYKDGAWTTI